MIEHAGYRRKIISRNPPLVDEDGYEIDSDEDDERVQDAILATADINPFGGVRLEGPLAVPFASVHKLTYSRGSGSLDINRGPGKPPDTFETIHGEEPHRTGGACRRPHAQRKCVLVEGQTLVDELVW